MMATFPVPSAIAPFSSMPEIFIGAALVALGCQFAVLYSAMTGRTPGSSRRRSARWIEVAWVLLPTIVLIIVLAATWNRLGAPVAAAPSAGVPA